MIPKILVLPGSNRSGAFSAALAASAALELAQQGADVTRISLIDYPLPIVDEDLKTQSGIPDNAMKLGRLIAAHHGVFLCSPEYNASIPPLLKNMIDWVSLISKDGERELKPWSGHYVALGSSSNGKFAGIRGLNHLRTVMINVGTQVVSEQCSVGGAADAFEADGRLKDERTQAMLAKTCKSLILHCTMMIGR